MLAAAPLLGGTATPALAAGPATLTFAYSGGTQAWTVPLGVIQATFDAYGGQGGSGLGNAGGRGGGATATLGGLRAGEVVTIVVGGACGSNDGCNYTAPAAPGAGGFNGGAAGGL